MTTIVNKKGETIAYLYLTIILDVKQTEVIGLMLGNCLFGSHTAPLGKFFNDTFRKTNGQIIGQLGKDVQPKRPSEEKRILRDAWKMLSNVKEHTCAWIEEKDSWTKEDIEDFLQNERKAAKK